jgi:acyl-CoA reductase-like NAD-dependent aldehyde dehydrogenase
MVNTLRERAEMSARAVFAGHNVELVPETISRIADAIEQEARTFARLAVAEYIRRGEDRFDAWGEARKINKQFMAEIYEPRIVTCIAAAERSRAAERVTVKTKPVGYVLTEKGRAALRGEP